MKKACFIIPYFGTFPNYFQLFLNSCKYNLNYSWLIITDDTNVYRYPNNVIVKYHDFMWLKSLIDKKMGFKCCIPQIHKLCDYKPAYGYIFEEYLSGYEFWGYCDLDILLGNLDDFITKKLFSKYDKIFCLGHMTLFRNTKENNRIFMSEINGRLWYKESFLSPSTTVFDETYGGNENINTIFKMLDKNIYENDLSFNCLIAPANLIKTTYNPQAGKFENEKFVPSIILWDSGHIRRYYIQHGKLTITSYPYIHFQARKMEVNCTNKERIKIMGDGFYDLEYPNINENNFYKIKKTIISLKYIKTILKWKTNGAIKRFQYINKRLSEKFD